MVTDFSKLNKILIIRLSSLGDILLTTPLIRSIKTKNPAIQIDCILRNEFTDVLQNNPHVNNIYKYSNQKRDKQILINTLVSKSYDLAIDLQNNLRSKEILSSIRCKILKFDKRDFRKYLLVHFKINLMKDFPQIPVRYAEAAGVELDNGGLDFFTDKQPDEKFKSEEEFIGLCPGAKHFTKRWPKEYFIGLGEKLESAGFKVVLFGGLNEAEITGEIEKKLNNSINFCCDSILQAGANMKMCKAIFTNDSGTMHLALAMRVPVIAFFGSTVKEFGFFPYKAKSIELENKNLSCRPCSHIGRKSCPKTHFKCMMEINPELAFSSLNNLLSS